MNVVPRCFASVSLNSLAVLAKPLLFVGHYWRQGQPNLIRPHLACLDYSAVSGGKLVAYRLGQEDRLLPSNFVWVNALEQGKDNEVE